jgi:hypothetical protein
VGTDDGNVQVSRDGGANWTLVNANIPDNPEYWVSRVEASHHQPGTAYVSFTGYRNDDFRPFVYKTTDYGQTWTSIAANLPPGPINVIREHHENPNLLFVGTEFQVFASIDGGASWISMKNNMPTQPVHDMQIHPREDDLIVATHGRGIYIADISALAELTPQVLAANAHFFQPESKVRWIGDDRTNYSSSNFAGESEPDAILMYYHLRSPVTEPVRFTVYQGSLPIAEVVDSAGRSGGLHKAEWDMNKRIERSQEEIQRIMAQRGGRGGGGGRGGQAAQGGQVPDNVRYAYSPAPPGEYRIVMNAGGQTAERTVRIIRDEWWLNRR